MSKSVFNSLSELKNESFNSKITFYHGLSEFTFQKLNKEIQDFFMENQGFIDNRGNLGPNIKLHNNFAIDTVSEFAEAKDGIVRIGQDLNTRKFIIFKPVAIDSDSTTQETSILNELERFQKVISHHEDESLGFLCMDFIDGVTFRNIKQLSDKINDSARYLISLNLAKEFEFFQKHHVLQQDNNFNNFIIDVRNFDVKIIDYERCDISKGNYFISNLAGLFDCVFSKFANRHEEYAHKMDSYAHDAFQGFLTKIINSEKNGGDFVDNIIGVLPFYDDFEII
jgi:hypothetical protein